MSPSSTILTASGSEDQWSLNVLEADIAILNFRWNCQADIDCDSNYGFFVGLLSETPYAYPMACNVGHSDLLLIFVLGH